MQSDHYPVIAHINLQLSTKPPVLKKQGKVFKPSTSEETEIMVNDILERWAIADKPRTYSDWIFQYQEMMETLPRQESKLFRIKHYISKETWTLVEEKFWYWNESNEEQRHILAKKVRKATRKDKIAYHLKIINSDMSCKDIWQSITRLRSDYVPTMYARKDKDGRRVALDKSRSNGRLPLTGAMGEIRNYRTYPR